MAKQALTWEDTLPLHEKQETKVVRLLRTGGSGWGVTETRSAFVYPQSLKPLRRLVGAKDECVTPGDAQDLAGLYVSRLLDEAFPAETNDTHTDSSDKVIKPEQKRSIDAESLPNTTKNAVSGAHSSPAMERRKSGKAQEVMKHENGAEARREGKSVGCKRRARSMKVRSRPSFYPYGNGNTAPSSGGVIYGGYMLSHSIIPQVLPNKPRTRQVHSGTQRVAAKAAANAKESRRSTKKPYRNGWFCDGRHRGGNDRSASSLEIRLMRPTGDNKTKQCGGSPRHEKVDSGDNVLSTVQDAERWSDESGTTEVNRLALFSAVPECGEGSRPSHCRSSTDPKRKTRQSAATLDVPASPGEDAATLAKEVLTSEEKEASSKIGMQEERDLTGRKDETQPGTLCSGMAPTSPSPALLHKWTISQRMANDPRNYKFLPRRWAGEIITPAGIPGPDSSDVETLFPRRGRGACRGRAVAGMANRARNGVHCWGVGDCLKWNLTS